MLTLGNGGVVNGEAYLNSGLTAVLVATANRRAPLPANRMAAPMGMAASLLDPAPSEGSAARPPPLERERPNDAFGPGRERGTWAV